MNDCRLYGDNPWYVEDETLVVPIVLYVKDKVSLKTRYEQNNSVFGGFWLGTFLYFSNFTYSVQQLWRKRTWSVKTLQTTGVQKEFLTFIEYYRGTLKGSYGVTRSRVPNLRWDNVTNLGL